MQRIPNRTGQDGLLFHNACCRRGKVSKDLAHSSGHVGFSLQGGRDTVWQADSLAQIMQRMLNGTGRDGLLFHIACCRRGKVSEDVAHGTGHVGFSLQGGRDIARQTDSFAEIFQRVLDGTGSIGLLVQECSLSRPFIERGGNDVVTRSQNHPLRTLQAVDACFGLYETIRQLRPVYDQGLVGCRVVLPSVGIAGLDVPSGRVPEVEVRHVIGAVVLVQHCQGFCVEGVLHLLPVCSREVAVPFATRDGERSAQPVAGSVKAR